MLENEAGIQTPNYSMVTNLHTGTERNSGTQYRNYMENLITQTCSHLYSLALRFLKNIPHSKNKIISYHTNFSYKISYHYLLFILQCSSKDLFSSCFVINKWEPKRQSCRNFIRNCIGPQTSHELERKYDCEMFGLST